MSGGTAGGSADAAVAAGPADGQAGSGGPVAEVLRVGVMGCGMISGIYLKILGQLAGVDVVACADVVAAKAEKVAAEHEGVRALSPEALLADGGVDLVLNLTIPAAHAEVGLAALSAGKHVYSEKPLAGTVADGRKLLDLAAADGLRVGCAPDTVLGTGIQTARKAIDDGEIGQPVAATAFFAGHGPDSWHANPAFFYQPGAGPLFDMGPYYLTSLVTLLGPIRRVVAMARPSFAKRRVTGGVNAGMVIDVGVDTHISAALQHESGAISTLITSFDVWAAHLPRIEVHGATGSLSVPDPNTFDGEVSIRRAADADWSVLPAAAGFAGLQRGIGVADLAQSRRRGVAHRASGELALHVLDAMESIIEAGHSGATVELSTTCARPAPVPLAGAEAFAHD